MYVAKCMIYSIIIYFQDDDFIISNSLKTEFWIGLIEFENKFFKRLWKTSEFLLNHSKKKKHDVIYLIWIWVRTLKKQTHHNMSND